MATTTSELERFISDFERRMAPLERAVDEAWWNLHWMLEMQDPADGGVYHKLTNLRFDGAVMPEAAREPRYVVQKTTAAALDLAAVMAMAARVYAPYEAQYPGEPARMRAVAKAAWSAASEFPDKFRIKEAAFAQVRGVQ